MAAVVAAASRPWEQTNKEVTLALPLPAGAKGKDVRWKLTSKAIELTVLGQALLSGEFFHPVRPDDSTWELEDAPGGGGGGRQIRIVLAKAKANQPWDCCFMDEIDETITHRTFMDIAIGGRKMGRVAFGLYGNAYPKTVENFRCLCTGEKGSIKVGKGKKAPRVVLHYKGTAIFRIVPGFLCQGGDVTRHPEHLGGHSIYESATFDDEGFKIKHKGAGDLLMANAGVAHNNHSQFAVAMARLTEFETKHVIFGKVLEGMDLLKVMELEGSGEGVTSREVVVAECGELDESLTPLPPPPGIASQPPSAPAARANAQQAAASAPAVSDHNGKGSLALADADDDDEPRIVEIEEPPPAPPAETTNKAPASTIAFDLDDIDDI